ncbi:GT2 family glycosyltransferase [Actinoalloteichus hoggarensis]|uniref:N-acetylglucosaminyl-diphospho-decaprenol L-rhamnosyltransferase n=1 Tax=Actinoalloteichus hoggarensis TaxID=1470176 RepID=A0A221WAW1_9PSEU|nr:glycosyltransferase family 2 protein [Actinoalloteichus hoggarensis]ASO22914.1 N-acetylglucosaminyl-diphospho-decaprenol L-rhamnosyltransferase [Actinoalloteichus hoggarensis]MBB5922518.1 GT2 family glycosyltransferase [Actinoalloteichus hoggarensis]
MRAELADGTVLVAVVTYNSERDLPALLGSLPAAMDGLRGWRLIVADNGSTDDTVGLVGRLAPYAQVVTNEANLGYAAGVNTCLALAREGEAVLVLNADVYLTPRAVPALLAACADPAVGMAVPLVRRPNGVREATLRRRPTALRQWGEALLGGVAGRIPALGERITPGAVIEADWANGAALLMPSRVVSRIGWWREDLFLYSEEVDYCRRVTDAGWRIRQVPSAVVYHRGGASTTAPELWAQLVTNRVVHLARWEGRGAARLGWLALVVGSLLRLPLCRATHRRALGALLRGRSRLVRGLPSYPATGGRPPARVVVEETGARP